jgi:hypothetical protein
MPGIMLLDAQVALYASTNVYWAAGHFAWAQETTPTPPPGSAKWCGHAAQNNCDFQLGQQVALCNARSCDSLCTSTPPSPLCAGCISERQRCVDSRVEFFENCATCPPGTTCKWDIGSDSRTAGYSRCCDGARVPCNGNCVSPSCGPREAFSVDSCRCECESPYVRAPNGVCACPPSTCPPSLPILDGQCNCAPCPPGLTNCGGECVDTLSDRNRCGGCSNVCGPGEDCCNGVCRPLYTNGRCGSCSLTCAGALHECCLETKAGHQCRNLAVDPNNCGACGARCDINLGWSCVNGQCVCSPNRVPCGLMCCGPGWACGSSPKGSICLCPTNRLCGPNKEDCCPVGDTCCGGATCCPPTRNCCGTLCCAAGEICCGTKCCPKGQDCCSGTCTTLGTPNQCASCTDRCIYTFDDPTQAPILGTCDSLRRCHCPAGWVVTAVDMAGGDLECCPIAAPYPCPNQTCSHMPC